MSVLPKNRPKRKSRKSKIEVLALSALRLDFQPPENLIEETVQKYIGALKAGERLPPVRVRFDGENYFLEDGFHRLEAARRFGIVKIEAEILSGGLAEMEAEWKDYLAQLKRSLAKKDNRSRKC